MIRSRIPLLTCAFLLIAANAFGYRREYIATVGDVRKQGSEVCFYRGDSAESAFSLYFTYGRVACLPADDVLDFPPGLFHAFARHRDGFISGGRDFFVNRGPAAPEAGYERLDLPMQRAAWADVASVLPTLRSGERLAVWIAPAPTASGTILPLVDGETSIMVPAERPFLPLVVANGTVVAAGEPLQLSAGERRIVAPFQRDRGDVMVWLKVDVGQTERELPPPEIHLTSGERRIDPLFPLHNGMGATHTLLFFRDVPAGAASLAVRGRTWVHTDTDIQAARTLTAIREPLLLVPGAAIEVPWTLDGASSEEGCGAKPRTMKATLSHCAQGRCRAIDEREVPLASNGAFSFDGLAAGAYEVLVESPSSKPLKLATELSPGDVRPLPASLTSFRIFGRVTVNGEPVQARLVFDTGETVSDQSGRYTAALAGDPLTNSIDVTPCGDDGRTLQYIPAKKPVENSAYDLDIRNRTVTVTVLAANGAAVHDARVRLGVLGSSGSQFPLPPLQSDDAGRVTFHDVQAGRGLRACAEADGHPMTCIESSQDEITLRMSAAALQGRITGHSGMGLLWWVDAQSRVTEDVVVRPDGRFTAQRPHNDDEHLVYASTARPLTVFVMPRNHDGELLFDVTTAPVTRFIVTVPEMTSEAGVIGLWISGRRIPFSALDYHLQARQLDSILERGRSMPIPDVAMTGEITAAFAPLDPAATTFVDPFSTPQYSGVRRTRVIGLEVVLPPR